MAISNISVVFIFALPLKLKLQQPYIHSIRIVFISKSKAVRVARQLITRYCLFYTHITISFTLVTNSTECQLFKEKSYAEVIMQSHRLKTNVL